MRDNERAKQSFIKLLEIMDRLRSPDGCPWDRDQSAQTMKNYLVEEAYEVTEAIEENNPLHACEELGDLLFLIVFMARLYEEEKVFDINGVMESITAKMIRRHPHVFGSAKVDNSDQVRENWHRIKQGEAKEDGEKPSFFVSVTRKLPALLRAHRVNSRASDVGFDWPGAEGVWEKLEEELSELKEAFQTNDPERMRNEIGDVLFTIANLGRHLHINAEDALQEAIGKFIKRFDGMRSVLEEKGRPLEGFSLDEMDGVWNEIKKSGDA
ncbi:MAG: nucleoside triphosphate pyrophosphohydrolase [Pseudomonadota bacterium]